MTRPWNVRLEMTMHGLFYVLWSSGMCREQVREFKDFRNERIHDDERPAH